MIFDQWHRHSTVVVKCCKLDAPPKSSKSLFVHQNQISMYTTMTTMSKTFGHEYTHYDIGFQQWQSGDTNFLSPLDAAASSCLLNVVTTKGCFVLSPTWIIWISISCTSERKTKKPTNIGFTNQRIARSFLLVMEREYLEVQWVLLIENLLLKVMMASEVCQVKLKMGELQAQGVFVLG
jgi:hypothetical protein